MVEGGAGCGYHHAHQMVTVLGDGTRMILGEVRESPAGSPRFRTREPPAAHRAPAKWCFARPQPMHAPRRFLEELHGSADGGSGYLQDLYQPSVVHGRPRTPPASVRRPRVPPEGVWQGDDDRCDGESRHGPLQAADCCASARPDRCPCCRRLCVPRVPLQPEHARAP